MYKMSNNPTSNFQDVPWKHRFFSSMIGFAVNFSRRSDGTINRYIMNLFDFKAPPSQQLFDGVKTSDTVVDATRNLYFRLFLPSLNQDDDVPVIVYFHGGGFAYLSASSIPCDDFCRRLCKKTGAVIISVNYRLAPVLFQ
ncbi:hypothetical protein ERO13_A08G228766v2 [Gossypium hirsutum]|nr:hypothetical protein ERO13_A08G228766v2 [Gossypium hirsutum]